MMFHRPPARVVAGLVVLGASYLFGWPAIAAFTALAAWTKRPKLLIGGPLVYGFSWLLFAAGLALIGGKAVSVGKAFGLRLVRKLADKFLPE
jgi:hypothetical protein